MKEKIIIYRDEKLISDAIGRFENSKKSCQKLIEFFNSLEIGQISTKVDLLELIQNSNVFIQGKIASFVETKLLGNKNLKINTGQFDLKAEDQKQIKELVSNCLNNIENIKLLAQIENGIVEIDEKLLNSFIDQHSIYAENENDVDIINFQEYVINWVMQRASKQNVLKASSLFYKLSEIASIPFDESKPIKPSKNFYGFVKKNF